MSRKTAGRRKAPAGGHAAVLAATPGITGEEGAAPAALAHQGRVVAQKGARRPPFLAAFLDWLRTESGRLVLPVTVDMATSSRGKLRIQGVHPAICIPLDRHREINASVVWEGEGWDALLWLDAHEKRGPGGVGWINGGFRPEFQVVHPTREALWRADVFEPLLTWINEDLAHATHLALWEMLSGATWARLVRDGKVLRTGWTLEENGGTPAHLLPVHGYQEYVGGGAEMSIAWLSTRSEHWPLPPRHGKPLLGVAYLQFGVGAGGVEWVARLARSSWFAGLEAQTEDLAVSGGVSGGRWAMPGGPAAKRTARATTETFFMSESLPAAWLAMVAVPCGTGPAGQAAALGLVGALRARCDPDGRALGVVVTVDAVRSRATDAFVGSLRDKGAFVVCPAAKLGTGAEGDHLHHLPLRTLTNPRQGQLIGVDFADYRQVWRPGRVADLHVVSFASGDAGAFLHEVSLPSKGSVRALTFGFHLDPDAPDQGLVEVDRFATACRERLLTPDGEVVFTTMDRLEGVTGSVDLLVIHERAKAGG